MRRIWVIAAGILLAASSQGADRDVRKARGNLPPDKIVTEANFAAWQNARFVPPRSLPPRRDDVLGDQFEAGASYYDYQTNGSVGRMIALDNMGGIHVTWMDGATSENAGTRHQKYNYHAVDADWNEADGVQVPPGTRSGYGCLTLSNEEEQRGRLLPRRRDP